MYGDAIAEIMTKNFQAIREINRAILEGSDSIFHIFNEAYKAELVKRGLDPMKAPSKEVDMEIIDVLKQKKLLPIAPGPVSAKYEEGIAFYNTERAPAEDNVYGNAVYDIRGDNAPRSLSASRRVYSKPGATGVVNLVNIEDSLGTAKVVSNHSVLEIFDAYVLGVNQSDVISQANKDFAEMNMMEDWSQLKAITETLERMSKDAEKDYPGINETVWKTRMNSMEDLFGYEIDPDEFASVNDQISNLKKLTEQNDKRREELRNKTFVVEQFVFDKEHGFEYNGKKIVVNKIINEINTKFKKADATQVINDIEAALQAIEGC